MFALLSLRHGASSLFFSHPLKIEPGFWRTTTNSPNVITETTSVQTSPTAPVTSTTFAWQKDYYSPQSVLYEAQGAATAKAIKSSRGVIATASGVLSN